MESAEEKPKPLTGQGPEDLVAWYRGILALHPGNVQARSKLGWLLQRLGRRDEALAQWQEVLRVDANNLTAREAILQLSSIPGEKVTDGETAGRGKTES